MDKSLITLARIVKTGLQNFVRNATLAVAAIAVMVITLSIILFSFIANATFSKTIQDITDKIDISVYLKDSITETEKDKLLSDLNSNQSIKQVNYLSKDQVFELYKNQNKDNLSLQLAIEQADNQLPATIQIKPKEIEKIGDIQSFLEKEDIKKLQSDPSSYSGDRRAALENITSATNFLRKAGLASVALFAIVSVLIIFNTIRMAIFNRRDELQIMRLLGANTSYIRGPFVVETVIYGIVSAIISITLSNAVFTVSSSAFEASSLGLLDIAYAGTFFASNFWTIFAGQLFAGILIGAVSSIIATRRYLKFKSPK
jgi:cell division transport system permease protein